MLLTCLLSLLATKGSRVLEEQVNETEVSKTVFSHLKGLAKLGNIVAEANVSQFRRAGNIYVAEKDFAARKQNMFLPGVKNIFASRTQILRPKHMFPSLATM